MMHSLRIGTWSGTAAVLGLGLLAAGCAGEYSPGAAPSAGAPAAEQQAYAQTAGESAPASPAILTDVPARAVRRRIIYTGTVDLVTENLTATQQKLLDLVKAHEGYVASTQVSGTPGTPRTGSWTVRVPVERYESFMAAVVKLGELQQINTDSQDVTEEYYDVEARLGNKRVEERRLLEHLERSTARLQDILAVERELSRVRGEIEQLQGRMRFLANQTELTTITVTAREAQEYIPIEGTGFGAQVARTFRDSIGVMKSLGEAAVLTGVALAPWLLVLGVIGAPLWIVLRRRRRSDE